MAGKRKSFEARPPVVVATTPAPGGEEELVIVLRDSTGAQRNLDFRSWLDRGIDEWVWLLASQIRAFLNGGGVENRTIVSYSEFIKTGLLPFLSELLPPPKPSEFNGRWMESYLAWLKTQTKWKRTTKRKYYSATKAILLALVERGAIPASHDLFTANPFPGTNKDYQGAEALSQNERVCLAEAVRADLIAIYHDRFDGPESEALSVHVLAIAMRTGANPTPLIELGRDKLKPHPFMPSWMLLELYKRRGNGTTLKGLRYSRTETEPVSIPLDGVGLLKKVLERTQSLAERAPVQLRNRIWLYASESNNTKGKITCLSTAMLTQRIRDFVKRHDLRDGKGARLWLNLSRLRKTMENRLWALSNGDLFTVSLLMGHTPQVADLHYLACTDEMRRNATFVGEALPDIYRSGGEGRDQKIVPITKYENTPVGGCKDSLYGEKSPKDGSHCDDFLSCFTCRSYTIVGARSDLHRLFSFYWFLKAESERIPSRKWVERFRWTMTLIDAFTRDKFDATLVAEVKDAARIAPIKFWKNYQLQIHERQ